MQRITRDATAYPSELLCTLEDKVSLLKHYFPPSVANLYASPKSDAGGLQWWSPLSGKLQPYADLLAQQQQALLRLYEQRQKAILFLADELNAQGKREESAALHSLVGRPDLNNLYSINGDPVIIRWGLPTPQPLVPQQPSVATAKPPLLRGKGTPLKWLLPLSLLLLLSLLWFWRGYLWHLISPSRMTNHACTPGKMPPDFVVVMDTSGSMNLSINASPQDEEWLYETGDSLPDTNPRKIRVLSEPTRMTVAKQAFGSMQEHLHNDIDTRLLTFDGCYATVDNGLFKNTERRQLEQSVQNLRANGGTPLADSLKTAADAVDGRLRDALIVMFVDGEDGCGKNACVVSERIARMQPRLRVNIVNISDSELSNCVAQNTGGRVYSAHNADEIKNVLRKASEEVSIDPNCDDPL